MWWNNSETMSHIWTFKLVFIDTRILRYPSKHINMQMHTCKHGHKDKYTYRHNHLHRRISLPICLQQTTDSTILRGAEVQQWCLPKSYPMTDRKKIYNQKSTYFDFRVSQVCKKASKKYTLKGNLKHGPKSTKNATKKLFIILQFSYCILMWVI